MQNLTLVCATRGTEALFERATFLGRSLSRFPTQLRPNLILTSENAGTATLGLPDVYNHAIEVLGPNDIIGFVHDDVYFHDWFLSHRVEEALQRFDVVGLAGSLNSRLSEPSWGFQFDVELKPLGWQEGLQRSGAVNHFDYTNPQPSWYGSTPTTCTLVDGLFLAARVETLVQSGVRFDPRFSFHLYDLDFCRSAAQAGLSIGTWPIAVTHGSGGAFETEDFRQAARRYLEKWRH